MHRTKIDKSESRISLYNEFKFITLYHIFKGFIITRWFIKAYHNLLLKINYTLKICTTSRYGKWIIIIGLDYLFQLGRSILWVNLDQFVIISHTTKTSYYWSIYFLLNNLTCYIALTHFQPSNNVPSFNDSQISDIFNGYSIFISIFLMFVEFNGLVRLTLV